MSAAGVTRGGRGRNREPGVAAAQHSMEFGRSSRRLGSLAHKPGRHSSIQPHSAATHRSGSPNVQPHSSLTHHAWAAVGARQILQLQQAAPVGVQGGAVCTTGNGGGTERGRINARQVRLCLHNRGQAMGGRQLASKAERVQATRRKQGAPRRRLVTHMQPGSASGVITPRRPIPGTHSTWA